MSKFKMEFIILPAVYEKCARTHTHTHTRARAHKYNIYKI